MSTVTHEWKPKHGKVFVVIMWVITAVVTAICVSVAVKAYAQSATAATPPSLDVKNLLSVLVPAVWASIGPLAIAAITKVTNSAVGAYVPRSLQVILSSVFGAIAASMADGGVTVAATAISGAASQVYAQTHPSSLLTTEKPQ